MYDSTSGILPLSLKSQLILKQLKYCSWYQMLFLPIATVYQ